MSLSGPGSSLNRRAESRNSRSMMSGMAEAAAPAPAVDHWDIDEDNNENRSRNSNVNSSSWCDTLDNNRNTIHHRHHKESGTTGKINHEQRWSLHSLIKLPSSSSPSWSSRQQQQQQPHQQRQQRQQQQNQSQSRRRRPLPSNATSSTTKSDRGAGSDRTSTTPPANSMAEFDMAALSRLSSSSLSSGMDADIPSPVQPQQRRRRQDEDDEVTIPSGRRHKYISPFVDGELLKAYMRGTDGDAETHSNAVVLAAASNVAGGRGSSSSSSNYRNEKISRDATKTNRRNSLTIQPGRAADDYNNLGDGGDDGDGDDGILENFRKSGNSKSNQYIEMTHQMSSSGSLNEKRKKSRSVLSLLCQRWMMKVRMMSNNMQLCLIAIISIVVTLVIFFIVVGFPSDEDGETSRRRSPRNHHRPPPSMDKYGRRHSSSKSSPFNSRAQTAEEYYLDQSGSLMNLDLKDGSKRNSDSDVETATATKEAERLNALILGYRLNSDAYHEVRKLFASRKTVSSIKPRIAQIDDHGGNLDDRSLRNVHPLEPRNLIGFLGWQDEPTRPLDDRYLELRKKNPKLLKQPDSLDKGDCQATAPEWQNSHRPTCVTVHESSSGWQQPYRDQSSDFLIQRPAGEDEWDISTGSPIDRNEINEQIRLINEGAFRQVWMIRDGDQVSKRVIKTLRVDAKSKKYDLRNFDRHRRDAVAFDQLQSSPLVVNIYGYCSNTAIFDYADGGLLDLFKSRPDISKSELLQIAYNVSLSVHVAHNFDDKGRPTMAHTDIKTDQFILQDGYYKLSDFNRVRFLMWNQKRNLPCGFRVEKNGGEYRSPEEYAYQVENEKVDVFSLGNVLYFLLTRQEPWVDFKLKHVYDLVKMGQRPMVPDEIRNNTGIFEETMVRAMELAWIHDRSQRPPALEVAKVIHQGLSLLPGSTL